MQAQFGGASAATPTANPPTIGGNTQVTRTGGVNGKSTSSPKTKSTSDDAIFRFSAVLKILVTVLMGSVVTLFVC